MIQQLLKGQRHQLSARDLERVVAGTGAWVGWAGEVVVAGTGVRSCRGAAWCG
jgi:uncharacterized protein with NRDE domain